MSDREQVNFRRLKATGRARLDLEVSLVLSLKGFGTGRRRAGHCQELFGIREKAWPEEGLLEGGPGGLAVLEMARDWMGDIH
jgi:hypothetical protein